MNLDEIHHESLQQLLNKVRPRPELTLIPDFPLFPGNVVEIQGASGSGKTHLIYAAIIKCILPVTAGGWFKAAILFDSDNSFDLNRFKSLLVSRLGDLSHTDPPSEGTQTLANLSLELLHIFRPTSSNQLASSILNLPSYHSAHLPHHEVGITAIDSLSAFYWPDRFTVEQLRSRFGDNTEQGISNPLRHVLIALERFRVRYNPLIICSNWGLTFAQLYSPSEVKFYKQHLHPSPSPFTHEGENHAPNDKGTLSVTHHITLNAAPTLQLRKQLDRFVDNEDGLGSGSVQPKQRYMTIGVVRTPGGSKTGSFSFTIESDALRFGTRV